jgi:hypothetical protein
MDNTLRRKSTIVAGDTNAGDAFDPSLQWDGFATDTFDGLGSHAIEDGDVGPAVSGTAPTNGATDVPTGANITITFSEPVHVTGSWFTIDCTSSDAHTATVADGPTTYTLNPDVDFAQGESCTVTVVATQVTDQDTDDPPDAMAGDHAWTFTTEIPPTPIHDLQGSGHISPFAGQQKTTTGIVTVILGNGFFLQDPVGDDDQATSDGIFVFTTASARSVTPGDALRVSGTVTEFRPSSRPRDLTLTELTSVTIRTVSTGNPLPAPGPISDRPDETIDPDGIDAFEALEGMLVAVATPTVVAATNDFGEFVVIAAGDAANATPNGNMVVGDLPGDSVDYNPERVMVDDEARIPGGTGSGTRINSPQVIVKVGAEASGDIVGALDYQFSNYRVQASHDLDHPSLGVFENAVAPTEPVTDLPDQAPFEGRIATFNVENLFDCVDAPGKDDDHPTCTAAQRAALDRQLEKLARAFQEELRAPQLAIIEETENAAVLTGDAGGMVPGTTDVPALLPRLDGNWDAVSFDASDVRGIEVAFVFDSDRVTLHDAFLATDALPDTGGIWNGDTFRAGREPLVGFFTVDDVDLIVIGNHFKSKGGPQCGTADALPDCSEAGDDPLYGDIQPPVRFTETLRHMQADYVRDLVDLLLADNPGSRILVGGDLNDFAFAEPGEGTDTVGRVTASATDPLTDLVLGVPQDERYTFLFEGNSQVLDHLLVNEALLDLVRGQTIAHFNADYPSAFGRNASTTTRSSDHDPLVATFCTDQTAPSLSVSVAPDRLFPPDHKYVTVEATASFSDDRDSSPTIELVSVTSSQADSGLDPKDRPNDIVILDDDTFQLRAERFGGEARIYTIAYRVTDACGNATLESATVTVPLSKAS